MKTEFLTQKLPQGYEPHELPADYTGKIWIEGQLRQFAHAVALQAEADAEIASHAKRLAMELECVLLACEDTCATAKWWDSAHEALANYQEACREVYK